MGTRGAIGFRFDQKDVLFYNHSDSYPEWLGVKMVELVKSINESGDWNALRDQVSKFQIVMRDDTPTEAQKAKARELGTIDLGVSESSEDDFYCLTRGAQGDLLLSLALGFGEVANNFVLDSLFCEYAYIINLDTMELEFYKGFNRDANAEGRYAAHGEDDEYAGIRLVGEAPLNAIPDDWQERFYPEESDDE